MNGRGLVAKASQTLGDDLGMALLVVYDQYLGGDGNQIAHGG
jgi:hypothetical protein